MLLIYMSGYSERCELRGRRAERAWGGRARKGAFQEPFFRGIPHPCRRAPRAMRQPTPDRHAHHRDGPGYIYLRIVFTNTNGSLEVAFANTN